MSFRFELAMGLTGPRGASVWQYLGTVIAAARKGLDFPAPPAIPILDLISNEPPPYVFPEPEGSI